jgi:hypothetical protein
MSDEKWREELKLTVKRKRERARRGSSHPLAGWLAGWLGTRDEWTGEGDDED